MHLMRSPLTKGLFARAIAQSGPGLLGRNTLGGGATLADREGAGVKYMESKGAKTLAEMRALPAASLLHAGGWTRRDDSDGAQQPVQRRLGADGSASQPSRCR